MRKGKFLYQQSYASVLAYWGRKIFIFGMMVLLIKPMFEGAQGDFPTILLILAVLLLIGYLDYHFFVLIKIEDGNVYWSSPLFPVKTILV